MRRADQTVVEDWTGATGDRPGGEDHCMRARVAGRVVAALGAVALAVAFLPAQASSAPGGRLPLEEAYETTVAGADVTFLDPATLEQRAGEDVSLSVRVRGDAESADADRDTAVRTYETTATAADGTLISPTTTTTTCTDRRTAEAVDCAAESVDGRRTDVRGLTLAFPPATPEQDRMMWDGVALASFPVRFMGTERFRGLEVQRYEHVVPEQVLRSVTVPGLLVGSAEPSSPAEVVYSADRVLLVEPDSGVVVSADEIVLTRLRAPDGTPGAVLLGGVFRQTPASVTDAIARAQAVIDRRAASGEVASWLTGGAGVVLLGLGGLLQIRKRGMPSARVGDGVLRPPVPVA